MTQGLVGGGQTGHVGGAEFIQPREGGPEPLPAAATGAKKPLDSEVERLLRFFEFGHLPPWLQVASRPCGELARKMAADLPGGPETVAGLRALLIAKDAFVRALLETKT